MLLCLLVLLSPHRLMPPSSHAPLISRPPHLLSVCSFTSLSTPLLVTLSPLRLIVSRPPHLMPPLSNAPPVSRLPFLSFARPFVSLSSCALLCLSTCPLTPLTACPSPPCLIVYLSAHFLIRLSLVYLFLVQTPLVHFLILSTISLFPPFLPDLVSLLFVFLFLLIAKKLVSTW